jgi:hypothetical protein
MLFISRNIVRVWIILFILIISIPLLDSYFGVLGRNYNTENRQLAVVPKIIWKYPLKFFKPFETYFNENFQGRSILIKWYAYWKIYGFNVSPFPDRVIIGKNNWLFLGNHNDKVLEKYRHVSPYTEEQLYRMFEKLEDNRKWLASKGIRYYVVIPPNSHSVYSEFLPNNIVKANSGSHLNSLTSYIAKRKAELNFLNLQDTLLYLKKNQENLLYYQTDTHWNNYGAYVGYVYLMKRIQEDFPLIKPLPMSEYKWVNNSFSGDLSNLLGLGESYKENNLNFVRISQFQAKDTKRKLPVPAEYTWVKSSYSSIRSVDNPLLPKAIIFRDSFSDAMIPYLQENFRESVFIWEGKIRKDLIEKEKPDIVIHEIVERLLENALIY